MLLTCTVGWGQDGTSLPMIPQAVTGSLSTSITGFNSQIESLGKWSGKLAETEGITIMVTASPYHSYSPNVKQQEAIEPSDSLLLPGFADSLQRRVI